MEGVRYLEPGRAGAGRGEATLDLDDGLRGAGEDDLVGGVVVGDDDRQRRDLGEDALDVLQPSRDRGHRSWRRRDLGHELTPAARDAEEVLGIERPRRAERRDLAEAVTTHRR